MDFNILKSTRKEKRVSLQSLRDMSGVSVSAIRRLEVGNGNLSTLLIILESLQLHLYNKYLRSGEVIGSFISRFREKKKISQRELARKAKISHPALWKLEHNNNGNVRTCVKIFDVLKLDVTIIPIDDDANNINEWYTPKSLLDRIYKIFPDGFDLDPSSPLDHKLTHVVAKKYYSVEDDGLRSTWGGYKTIFVNPPYQDPSAKIREWLQKALDEKDAEHDKDKVIILLIQSFIADFWSFLVFPPHANVIFLTGRQHFDYKGTGVTQSSRFSCALIIYSTDTIWSKRKVEKLRDEFDEATFL